MSPQQNQLLSTCALPPPVAWSRLVQRSHAAWSDLRSIYEVTPAYEDTPATLSSHDTLSSFLAGYADPSIKQPHFWFFQLRSAFLAQTHFTEWSEDKLDGYVLMPAIPGFIFRSHHFFISHFWHTETHPDPEGVDLRLNQGVLEGQSWEYVWVDWSCVPQTRARREPGLIIGADAYAQRCLRNVSDVIREAGFTYYYPDVWEPRLWILWEVAEYHWTSELPLDHSSDLEPFVRHVREMATEGVQKTLQKYGYRCREEADRRYLVSWLELGALLRKLCLSVTSVRMILRELTPFENEGMLFVTCPGDDGPVVSVDKFAGILESEGETYHFTPCPAL